MPTRSDLNWGSDYESRQSAGRMWGDSPAQQSHLFNPKAINDVPGHLGDSQSFAVVQRRFKKGVALAEPHAPNQLKEAII